MSVAWYYARGGERRGPMSWDELRAAARAGSFSAEDLVWTPGYGATLYAHLSNLLWIPYDTRIGGSILKVGSKLSLSLLFSIDI